MIRTTLAVAALAAGGLASQAAQAEDLVLQPVQVGTETVRYVHGQATVDLRQNNGVVEVYTLPRDHGGLAFGVAVFNAGNVPSVIDTGNFTIEAGKQVVAALTVNRLVKKAEHRAGWSKFGTGLLGGLAAGLMASSRDTYSGTVLTPYGIYTASYSTPSLIGQIEADRILDHTYAKVGDIQARLDATRAQLGDSIVQTSTVDPGGSYGGRIVFDKLASAGTAQPITLRVAWNGEVYTFGFRLAKPGTPTPAFTPTLTTPMPGPASAQVLQPDGQRAALTRAAYVQPQGYEDRNAFPRPQRRTAAGASAPSPRINVVVQQTANYYINPLRFDDGSVATHFAAAGSRLSMLVKMASVEPASEAAMAKVGQAICGHRAMVAVVGQGGTISATLARGNGQKITTVELDAAACGV